MLYRISFLLAISLLIMTPVLGSEGSWVESIESPVYFAVSVGDIERAATWYRSAFGLEVLDDSAHPEGAWRIINLHRDGLFIELIYDARDTPKDAAKRRSQGIAKVGFRVPDVRKVADRIESATGDRPRVIEFARHEIRLIQLNDPEGNIIQLSSPLSTAESAKKPSDP